MKPNWRALVTKGLNRVKTFNCFSWLSCKGHWLVLLALSLAFSGRAQSSTGTSPNPGSLVPTVTIQVTDPLATWMGNPGVFTVFRYGNPAPALNVYYQISGTASNGVDYRTIGNWVQIPSGVLSGDIIITPINKGQLQTKTVTLTLTNSMLMNPVNYGIGSPSSATLDITADTVTNLPPLVSLLAPTNGASFWTPLNLPIVACASDPDGFVTRVEFLANGVSLGVVTNSVTLLPALANPLPPLPPMPPYRPFVWVWSNVPPGTNILLTAKATDNQGASTLSAPISITVHPGPAPTPPPPTNLPPVVRITSPAEGATFRASVNLPIYAYAADKDGFVTGVEFFTDTNDLGPGHRVNVVPPPLPPGPVQPPILIFGPTNYWELVWSNASQGNFALTAVATANNGFSAVSAPVNVTILPPLLPPPTPTNVVNIVAIDPVAIEGTNCWPWLGVAGATPTWTNWTASSAVRCYFTNCGPKNALLAVHRFGDTNNDLTVSYSLGGTATNGLDYVTLSNSVTIPAGQRTALIVIVPLDDGLPGKTSSVVLRLTSSADYVIGRPASAAAIILDAPSVHPVVLPDKTFHVSAGGPNGAWFHVEYTTDLHTWTALCTNQVIHGSIDFLDPDAPTDQVRFYRAVPETNPAAP
jgi:hypothetical protein